MRARISAITLCHPWIIGPCELDNGYGELLDATVAVHGEEVVPETAGETGCFELQSKAYFVLVIKSYLLGYFSHVAEITQQIVPSEGSFGD